MATSAKTVAGIGLLGALAGAALTVATTALLDSPTGRTPPSEDRARPLEARASEADRASLAVGPKPGATSEGAGADGATRGLESSLAAMLAEEVALPARVPGRITGHVRMQDGRPLAGVVIHAWPSRPGAHQGYWHGRFFEPPSFEHLLRENVRDARWSVATRKQTRTDEAGAFALEDLLGLDYYLHAQAEGYEIRSSGRGRGVARAGGSEDFVASPLVALALVVLMPDGTAPAEATIRWTDPQRGGGGAATWSKSERDVQVNPGTWSVYAEIGEEMRSPRVTVTTGATSGPVTLQLEARNSIRGTVRFDPADNAWQIAWVTAHRRDAGVPADPGGGAGRGGGGGGRPKEDVQRANPRPPEWDYQFVDLAPGEYEVTVGVTDGGVAPLASAVVRVSTGTVEQSFVLPRLTATHVLEARVLGAGGEPVPADDVSFSIVERHGGSMGSTGTRHAQRADGTFLVAVMSPEAQQRERMRELVASGRLPPGTREGTPLPQGFRTYLQVLLRSSSERKEVEFEPGQTTRVEVSFR